MEAACGLFCEQVNARSRQATRRALAEMLTAEQGPLHPVPAVPFTGTLGHPKTGALSLVSLREGRHSLPHQLAGKVVRVRRRGELVVIAW
jgi:hypothetical protein